MSVVQSKFPNNALEYWFGAEGGSSFSVLRMTSDGHVFTFLTPLRGILQMDSET